MGPFHSHAELVARLTAEAALRTAKPFACARNAPAYHG